MGVDDGVGGVGRRAGTMVWAGSGDARGRWCRRGPAVGGDGGVGGDDGVGGVERWAGAVGWAETGCGRGRE